MTTPSRPTHMTVSKITSNSLAFTNEVYINPEDSVHWIHPSLPQSYVKLMPSGLIFVVRYVCCVCVCIELCVKCVVFVFRQTDC
jgi:hypothetical protein